MQRDLPGSLRKTYKSSEGIDVKNPSSFDEEVLRELITSCWCTEFKKKFGLVFRRDAQVWVLHHSFLTSQVHEDAELAKVHVEGEFSTSHSYNGCKYCAANSFWQCGACKALNCCISSRLFEGSRVSCVACGNSGAISGQLRSLRGAGD